MSYLTEAQIEQILLEQLQSLGYTHLADMVTNPDGSQSERESYSEVVLTQRLRQALDRLNPTIPAAARDDSFKKSSPPKSPTCSKKTAACTKPSSKESMWNSTTSAAP